MSLKFHSVVAGALAAAGFGFTTMALIPQAHADAWDKKTYVTVNEPIIAGNKVLDPGTYVWKLLDSPSERHVVQIFDKDQQHLQTTVIAIPNYRLQPTGKTQFAFWETPAGVPKAVRAWFYPGDNFGQEFAYPKKLVAQLASAAPVPVPMAYHEPEAAPAPAPQPEARPEPEPTPAPAPVAEPQPQAAQNTAPAVQSAPAPRALPHTASSTPLFGILGLACLSLAGLMSFTSRSSSLVRK